MLLREAIYHGTLHGIHGGTSGTVPVLFSKSYLQLLLFSKQLFLMNLLNPGSWVLSWWLFTCADISHSLLSSKNRSFLAERQKPNDKWGWLKVSYHLSHSWAAEGSASWDELWSSASQQSLQGRAENARVLPCKGITLQGHYPTRRVTCFLERKHMCQGRQVSTSVISWRNEISEFKA